MKKKKDNIEKKVSTEIVHDAIEKTDPETSSGEGQSYEIGTKIFHIFYGYGHIIGEGLTPNLVKVDFYNGNVFGVLKSRIKDNTITH